jgi:DNA-binding PadR family transcriptional regulator
VTASTEASQDGPPRKSFGLTELGQKILTEMNTHWDVIIESIDQIRKGEFNYED